MAHRKKKHHYLKKQTKKLCIASALLLASLIIKIHDCSIFKIVTCSIVYHAENLTSGNFLNIFNSYEESVGKMLNEVEPTLVASFYDAGGTIVFIPFYDMNANREYDIAGYYNSGTKTIYIAEQVKAKIYPIVLHEFGHFADKNYYHITEDEEFIRSADADILGYAVCNGLAKLSNYGFEAHKKSGNYDEFTACTFADYYTCPTFLKISAPNIYEYYNRILKEYDK